MRVRPPTCMPSATPLYHHCFPAAEPAVGTTDAEGTAEEAAKAEKKKLLDGLYAILRTADFTVRHTTPGGRPMSHRCKVRLLLSQSTPLRIVFR